LDRPIEDLIPTADRPLASDAESIRSRYRERYSRYRATCDVHVEVKEKDAEAVAEEIGKDYETK
jgi:shikimate kinase